MLKICPKLNSLSYGFEHDFANPKCLKDSPHFVRLSFGFSDKVILDF